MTEPPTQSSLIQKSDKNQPGVASTRLSILHRFKKLLFPYLNSITGETQSSRRNIFLRLASIASYQAGTYTYLKNHNLQKHLNQ